MAVNTHATVELGMASLFSCAVRVVSVGLSVFPVVIRQQLGKHVLAARNN